MIIGSNMCVCLPEILNPLLRQNEEEEKKREQPTHTIDSLHQRV